VGQSEFGPQAGGHGISAAASPDPGLAWRVASSPGASAVSSATHDASVFSQVPSSKHFDHSHPGPVQTELPGHVHASPLSGSEQTGGGSPPRLQAAGIRAADRAKRNHHPPPCIGDLRLPQATRTPPGRRYRCSGGRFCSPFNLSLLYGDFEHPLRQPHAARNGERSSAASPSLSSATACSCARANDRTLAG
jgi:hypothetical protein